MCFGAEAPWRELVDSDAEFSERVELTADQCVVDATYFFVRGHIEIPVAGLEEPFCWSVWSSLSEKSFREMTARWNEEGRENDPPYFGWLCTNIPCYEQPSLHLKSSVQTRPVGRVPLVTITEQTHPLYEEQNDGVPTRRIEQIAHELLHGGGKPR